MIIAAARRRQVVGGARARAGRPPLQDQHESTTATNDQATLIARQTILFIPYGHGGIKSAVRRWLGLPRSVTAYWGQVAFPTRLGSHPVSIHLGYGPQDHRLKAFAQPIRDGDVGGGCGARWMIKEAISPALKGELVIRPSGEDLDAVWSAPTGA